MVADDTSTGEAAATPIAPLVPDWPAPPAVRAFTTTRAGGVSAGPYASLNLAGHVGDDPAAVAENRRRLGAALGLPAPPLWLEQVHGVGVVDAARAGPAPRGDGSWTERPGVVCAVLTADCLPVLLCDRAGSRVAAVHAGWRGLAAGVVEAGVAALGRPGEALMAWLGPAIGPVHFEVGGEVREAFVGRHPQAEAAFRPSPGRRHGGCWLADIYRLARVRLAALGVQAVYGGGLCTYADHARFYSYRRQPPGGRMASLIWLQGA
jgi:YfiH family protein